MFRKINNNDLNTYLHYVDIFYNSDVVESPVPKENYMITFNELMRSDEYIECYIFEDGDVPFGFALISKSFSQEAGGLSLTIEEIYIDEKYRGKGHATSFFEFLFSNYKASRFRIEVENDNVKAKDLYKRLGFEELPYIQMVIDRWKKSTL